MSVYGLSEDDQKQKIVNELDMVSQLPIGPSMLNGDFSMTYEARNKNNNNLNRRMMRRLCKAIDMAGLRKN